MQKYTKQDKDDFGKRVYRFMLELVLFIDSLPKEQACRVIGNQLLRSGTSLGANYFEAKSSSSKKEYLNYFQISLKSANETIIWLRLLRDSGKCKSDKLDWLLKEATELSNIFASSVLTMKGKKSL